MLEKQIISQLCLLPESMKLEVSNYIAFLTTKSSDKRQQFNKKKVIEYLAVLKGNINFHLIMMHHLMILKSICHEI